MQVVHFAGPAEFRRWLERHHVVAAELHIGFYKKSSGKSGLTYFEAVDEALCFGWIDGIVRRLDEERYSHRFTPRRPGSTWSRINVEKVQRLRRAGRMHPAGLAAFAARTAARTGIYTYEQPEPKLPSALGRVFRSDAQAWKRWQSLPPGYRRTALRWVTGAKQTATRARRLDQLIQITRAGARLGIGGPPRPT